MFGKKDTMMRQKQIADERKILTTQSKLLLSLMEKLPDVKFVNGSFCVDFVRMVKDENEQVLMIEASSTNDQAIRSDSSSIFRIIRT